MDDIKFEQKIRNASFGDMSYEGGANAFARMCLEYYEAHPEHQDEDAYKTYRLVKSVTTERIKLEVLQELTGFMVGWAVNAAKHILKLKHVPNPAFITINLDKK